MTQDAIAGIPLISFKLAMFDLDGTLISSYMENALSAFDQWSVLPNRLPVLKLLRSYGNSVAIVSNQGGVAFGLTSTEEVEAKIEKVAAALEYAHCVLHDGSGAKELDPQFKGGGEIEAYVAYDHPKASVVEHRGDARRKPNATMLIEALRGLDRSEAIFVGDRPEDEQAAAAAGIRFVWAEDFFAAA